MVDFTKVRNELLTAWSAAQTEKDMELAASIVTIIADVDKLSKLPTVEERTSEWKAEVLRLKNSNKLVEAVKLYRSKSGLGLMESKYAVENMK